MKKIKLTILIAIPALMVAGIVLYLALVDKEEFVLEGRTQGESPEIEIDIEHRPELFNKAKNLFPPDKKAVVDNSKGGIVPHHDMASEMIAEFFQKLPDDIETVILVGPNHTDGGSGLALSGNVKWKTAFGEVESDKMITEKLVKDGFIKLDDGRLKDEHSINTILPFVKYYLPEAKVVPIILSSKHDLGLSSKLGKELSGYLEQEKTVVIGSIDFSHYLPTEVTRQKDQETKKAIEERDYDKVNSFANDNVDSPPSLIVVMKTMDAIGAEGKMIGNKDLADVSGSSSVMSSTSYFTFVFKR